jgi:hypothetical protein
MSRCGGTRGKKNTYYGVRYEHRLHDVGGVERYPQKGGLSKKFLIFLDVLIDTVLAFKMWDRASAIRNALIIWECTPDVVLEG